MGQTFRDSDSSGEKKGRLRRAPDYTSRPVKLRLFALVAALMAALFIADKARDPQNWRWFISLDRKPSAERIDNRLPHRESPTAGEPVGTVVISSGDNSPAEEGRAGSGAGADHSTSGAASPSTAPGFDPVAKAWNEGLQELWNQLSMEERTLLYRLLETAAEEKLWPEADRTAAEVLVVTLNTNWTEHHVAAFQSVAQLQGEEQALGVDVLRQANDRWNHEVKEALETLVAGSIVLPDQRDHLNRFLADLNALNLSRVRDDSPFLRPEENQLWHHLFWQLRRNENAALAARSQGEIAYAQLYRQPEKYRGQVVTVRGEVKWAYRVQASRNHLGIKEYFLFWIRPFESADTPLVVYALDVPPGFPHLKDRDRDGQMTMLNEEVLFHGYLFKRGAYAGRGGNYNAPLVLARVAEWTPQPFGLRETEFQGSRVIWPAAAVALALATLIAAGVYWMSFRRKRQEQPKDEKAILAALRSIRDVDVLPPPQEALRQIERDARIVDDPRPEA